MLTTNVREMKTIPILYGLKGTGYWVLGFTIIHLLIAALFFTVLSPTAIIGVSIGLLLLVTANLAVQVTTPESALKVLLMSMSLC
jgi:4-hydroxybenzoate polyprenyltransferase